MDKILGAAVIGTGFGKNHAKAYAENPLTRLIAVCDKRLDAARQVAQEHAAPLATADYHEAVADPRVDVVSVAGPDFLHADMCVAALEAGKDVLCEKPLALTMDDCRRIADAAKRTGRALMVGQICRYAPGFALAHKLVMDGAIGDLFFVESEYAHHYEKARGTDDWRVDPRRHAVIGGGCHAVDLLRWVAGNPTEVTAYANHKSLLDWPVDDCTVAILRFPNNVIGKVFCSIGCRRPYTMRSVFYGTRGTVLCDNKSPAIQVCRHGLDPLHTFVDLPVDIAHHNINHEVREFIDAIHAGRKPEVDALEGARTVAVASAIVESARTGKPETVRYL